MNIEVKEQWMADLRSGEFPQGRVELHSASGHFCCLGVLLERQSQTNKKIKRNRDHKGNYGYRHALDPTIAVRYCGLSSHLQEMLGIDHLICCELMSMNDIDGMPFPEIADWIEENVK